MRNIVQCYMLCKFVLDNGTFHACGSSECKARALIGASLKDHKSFQKTSKKETPKGKTAEFIKFLDRTQLYQELCEKQEYIKAYYCPSTKDEVLVLTVAGLRLTDNLLAPFTPVGLWKEIWKEHKFIFSLIYSLVLLLFGGTIAVVAGLIKLLVQSIW